MKKQTKKRVTKKQLLESIESLKAENENFRSSYRNESNQRHSLFEKVKELEKQMCDLNYQRDQLRETARLLELQLAEEDARAEAFEFVLRMQNKYPVVEPAKVGGGVVNANNFSPDTHR